MDISLIISFFVGCIGKIIDTLNFKVFTFGAVSASLWQIMLSLVFLSMVISVFWKGAKG